LSGAKRPDPPDRRPGHLNVAAHRRLPAEHPVASSRPLRRL